MSTRSIDDLTTEWPKAAWATRSTIKAGLEWMWNILADFRERYVRRREYAELMALNDRMLKDIGLDRSEIGSVLANTEGERKKGRAFIGRSDRTVRKWSHTGAALVVAVAGTVLLPVEPAEAKPQDCRARYLGCQSRCFKRNEDALPCIERTCNVQFDNCTKDDNGPGSDGAKGKGGKGGKSGGGIRVGEVPGERRTSEAPAPQSPVVVSPSAPKGGPVVRDHRSGSPVVRDKRAQR